MTTPAQPLTPAEIAELDRLNNESRIRSYLLGTFKDALFAAWPGIAATLAARDAQLQKLADHLAAATKLLIERDARIAELEQVVRNGLPLSPQDLIETVRNAERNAVAACNARIDLLTAVCEALVRERWAPGIAERKATDAALIAAGFEVAQ